MLVEELTARRAAHMYRVLTESSTQMPGGHRTIQPAGLDGAQEELGAVGAWAGIGHGQHACSSRHMSHAQLHAAVAAACTSAVCVGVLCMLLEHMHECIHAMHKMRSEASRAMRRLRGWILALSQYMATSARARAAYVHPLHLGWCA